MGNLEGLIKRKQIADAVGISQPTVIRYEKEGVIKASKVGGKNGHYKWFTEEDILTLKKYREFKKFNRPQIVTSFLDQIDKVEEANETENKRRRQSS